jgi:hypothetical protein
MRHIVYMDRYPIEHITSEGTYEVLQFFIYEEMGITNPTLYGTMMTQEVADSMWKNTSTIYYPHKALGQIIRKKVVKNDDHSVTPTA